MIQLVDVYQAGGMDPPRLVGELEGALDAGDFREQALVQRWYELWGPLEVHGAVRGSRAAVADVAEDLAALRCWLVEHPAEGGAAESASPAEAVPPGQRERV
jgi:hypothetical protein